MKAATTPYDEQIEKIMDYFDFGKVAKAMRALGWKWVGSETESLIPDEPELRQEARRLLKQVNRDSKQGHFCSCGGFEARNEDGCLSLRFVVAEWEIQPDDEPVVEARKEEK
jgi:hypothetical protein